MHKHSAPRARFLSRGDQLETCSTRNAACVVRKLGAAPTHNVPWAWQTCGPDGRKQRDRLN
eukprot:9440319-Alexandrium_andersonii.AAC.1